MLRVPVLALAFLFLGTVALAMTGCKKQEQKAVPERAVNVRIWTSESRSLRPFVESVGTLKAYEEVTVSAEVDGILQTILVEEGVRVVRGQLVAEIRDIDYRLAEQQAAAALKQAEASHVNLQEEFRRKEILYREELVTSQQYDDIAARLTVAAGGVERDKAGLTLARERLAKTRITAPLEGSVKEKRVAAGDYVRNGTALLTLIETRRLKLSFSVSEKEVGRLRQNQEVVFTVDAFPGREYSGVVRMIHPSLDERTRSLTVDALVPNGEGSLKPGFFARVTLFTGPPEETVVVPITALLYDGSEIKLFIIEGERARERKVTVGRKYGEFMEVSDGLKAGEVVVTVGQNSLMEGALVHVAR